MANADLLFMRKCLLPLLLLLGGAAQAQTTSKYLVLFRDKNNSPYATSRPGVYAVGDVRSGSVKRVASSVGEGSVVMSSVHQYLAPAS